MATDVGGRDPAPSGVWALVPAVLGLAAAVYLTIEHFSASATLACPETATVNCQKVTTSSYSHLLGVPVALGGAIYFVVMVALLSPPAWAVRALDAVRVVAVVLGVVSVLYLVWAELFEIDAICIWCSVVHACTLWMFGAVLWYVLGRSPAPPPAARVSGRGAGGRPEGRSARS